MQIFIAGFTRYCQNDNSMQLMMEILSLAAAANDEMFIKITTFPFQCLFVHIGILIFMHLSAGQHILTMKNDLS